MQLRPGLSIDDTDLATFASRHGVVSLELFGSALRGDFTAKSDIDLLVTFAPGRTPGLLRFAAMELELGSLLGREVELRTREDLSRIFRDTVANHSRRLYAA